MDSAGEAANPIHQRSDGTVAWTTVNAAENIPGILTPLGYDFWIRGVDVGALAAFASLGVVPRREVRSDRGVDQRIGGSFYGRFAVNVSEFRRLMDLTPGGSGDVFTEQIFGTSPSGDPVRSSRLRYPLVALKAPALLAGLPKAVPRSSERTRAWWREFTSVPEQSQDGSVQLAEALRMMQRAVRMQMLATFAAQGLYERIGQLASGVGRPEMQLQLSTGYGGIEETRMVSALHQVAQGNGSVEEFIAVYGARCPGENELSAYSWRERPDAITKLVQKYRDAPDRHDPLDQVETRVRERETAECELLRLLSPVRRPAARTLLRLARTYIPLREEAKGLMAMAMDAGRFAARGRGRELVGGGVLDEIEDVFLLTLEEADNPPSDVRDLVVQRKSLRSRYATLDLPRYWLGDPEPIQAVPLAAESVDEVRGVPGACGVAEGRARVIMDAVEIDSVEFDEVLVCRTTDPSWASVFHLVAAVVIDIGGTGSHGAIVSREMGLPCVINTGNGTGLLRTGDLLRVDGTNGIVQVLKPAGAPSPVRTSPKGR